MQLVRHSSIALAASCGERAQFRAMQLRSRSSTSVMAAPSSAATGVTFRTEFAVAMTCASCVASVNEALKDEPGVDTHAVSLADQRVVVEGRGASAHRLGLQSASWPLHAVEPTLGSRSVVVRYRSVGSELFAMRVCGRFEASTLNGCSLARQRQSRGYERPSEPARSSVARLR